MSAEEKHFGRISIDQRLKSSTVCKITWVIQNFRNYSCKVGNYYESPCFFSDAKEEHEWTLDIFPNGYNDNSKDSVSILAWKSDLEDEDKFAVLFTILDETGNKNKMEIATCNAHKNGGLIKDFICRKDLLQTSQILPNGELRIVCYIFDLSKMVMDDDTIGKTLCSQVVQLESFEKLLNNEKLSDFKLVVKGKEFKVHRAVLAARSPVFEAMFNSEMREVNEKEANIDDIEPTVMEKMLRFVYTGKVNLEDLDGQMLMTADKYQLDSLKLLCENELVKKLSINNVYDVLLLADQNNATILEEKAMIFFDKHLKKLAAAKDFATSIASLPTNVKNEIIRVIALNR